MIESADEGYDRIETSVTYTAPANVEAIMLTGTASISGTGNALDNDLVGNAGANRLDGRLGADRMIGGLGNDSYVVDNVGDLVLELAGEGTDTVSSSIDYVLGGHLENLTLTGADDLAGIGNELANVLTANAAGSILQGLAGNDTLRGGLGADSLYGGEGNDRLDGGAGADLLVGGSGNDIYIVDNADDVLVELTGEGIDSVQTLLSHTLAANIENLTLTGTNSLVATGNDLNNVITANTAASAIWGLGGNDTLRGGVSADTLYGGDGNDRLDGGAGADQLAGGTGNDLYVVDDAGDTVIEQAGEGVDLVQSSVSYTLGDQLENLTLIGTTANDGTGNELNNTIVGNAAANWLRGLGGNDVITGGAANDTLEGGAGADRLNGGLGADTYVFGRGDGQDTLTDVDGTAGVQDVLSLGSGIAADQVWLRRLGNNLEVSVIGTTDKATISGWYLDANHHVEVIELANGQRLLDSQVQNLVQAMASFAPPAVGETSLPQSYHNGLDGVIAANWQ